jgi:hypothetical protein
VKQQNGARDVGAIRISHGNYFACIETIGLRSGLDELRQLRRPELQIRNVEYAFCQASEKAGHAVLERLTSETQQMSAAGQGLRQALPDRNQIRLIAASAVQKQQNRRRSVRGWNKPVMEIEVCGRHWITPAPH